MGKKKLDLIVKFAALLSLLIASSELAQKELGWKPKYADLESIVKSAWEWHLAHPLGYEEE